ncbi:L,D-transpeptidase [Shimia litoralis]|uniref:L,D-transpeptidase n=1 Tax=Shimia litoralis TaxID=420403 RepID=A0A4U7N8M1_9RHOB|nr:L,D-transpeptidase [Shimia litoralis]TKZ22138.1 L,D-transpeptidase [Shimia litoralis]
MTTIPFRALFLITSLSVLAACSGSHRVEKAAEQDGYGAVVDNDITIPAVDPQYLDVPNRREVVSYFGTEEPGTIVVDPYAKFLYFVEEGGQATRYPVAVGREGRGFKGQATIRRKAEWPGWTPTKNMLRSEPEVYGPFAKGIPGGVASPLGARALYLYRGGRDTYYRIHGTNDVESIGNANSAGCIRMFNQDVIDLAERTPLETQVFVRTYDESVMAEGEEMANRGVELPPKIVDPEVVYAAVEADKERRKALEAATE